jgi:hypothetical protein
LGAGVSRDHFQSLLKATLTGERSCFRYGTLFRARLAAA